MKPDPSTIAAAGPAATPEQTARLREAWKTPTGWRYWSAVNNSQVGLWYTGMSFVFFLFAGVLALLMRVQLAVPDNDSSAPPPTASCSRCTARR
jgi:hypothetical protein